MENDLALSELKNAIRLIDRGIELSSRLDYSGLLAKRKELQRIIESIETKTYQEKTILEIRRAVDQKNWQILPEITVNISPDFRKDKVLDELKIKLIGLFGERISSNSLESAKYIDQAITNIEGEESSIRSAQLKKTAINVETELSKFIEIKTRHAAQRQTDFYNLVFEKYKEVDALALSRKVDTYPDLIREIQVFLSEIKQKASKLDPDFEKTEAYKRCSGLLQNLTDQLQTKLNEKNILDNASFRFQECLELIGSGKRQSLDKAAEYLASTTASLASVTSWSAGKDEMSEKLQILEALVKDLNDKNVLSYFDTSKQLLLQFEESIKPIFPGSALIEPAKITEKQVQSILETQVNAYNRSFKKAREYFNRVRDGFDDNIWQQKLQISHSILPEFDKLGRRLAEWELALPIYLLESGTRLQPQLPIEVVGDKAALANPDQAKMNQSGAPVKPVINSKTPLYAVIGLVSLNLFLTIILMIAVLLLFVNSRTQIENEGREATQTQIQNGPGIILNTEIPQAGGSTSTISPTTKPVIATTPVITPSITFTPIMTTTTPAVTGTATFTPTNTVIPTNLFDITPSPTP